MAGPARGKASGNTLAGDTMLAFCWAHLRRQFVKIVRNSAPAPALVAAEALVRIGQLYTLEAALRGRSADERRARCQSHAAPLAAAMKDWFQAQLTTLSAKGDTAKAIRYALNYWQGLTLCLDDGRIEMDTNSVERAMRPIKLNAKNAVRGMRFWCRALCDARLADRDLQAQQIRRRSLAHGRADKARQQLAARPARWIAALGLAYANADAAPAALGT
jgi:hypothetical protein